MYPRRNRTRRAQVDPERVILGRRARSTSRQYTITSRQEYPRRGGFSVDPRIFGEVERAGTVTVTALNEMSSISRSSVRIALRLYL